MDNMDSNALLNAYSATISLIEVFSKGIIAKKERKTKEAEIIKHIILNQRNLCLLCKGDYDSQKFIDYENKIINCLNTYFDNELSNCFAIDSKDIFWCLRYKAEISDYLVETSLERFIKMCQKRKYEVQ